MFLWYFHIHFQVHMALQPTRPKSPSLKLQEPQTSVYLILSLLQIEEFWCTEQQTGYYIC